jgi:Ca-activated chloride channel family protein
VGTSAVASGWLLGDPLWLLALLALPVVAWLRRRRGHEVWVLPFAASWAGASTRPRQRLPELACAAGLVLLILALARPQHVEERHFVLQKGYDIVLAIDLSGSMLAEDYEGEDGERINRLQAIQPIIEAFVDGRPGDRIGVVPFAGRAYTLAPLSFDHAWLRRQIGRLRVGIIEDGTAVGDALALAVSRLGQVEREQAGRRLGGFVILLTDGANNAGLIQPREAAALAAAKGIPVYTIGAGQEGPVPMPVFDEQGRKLGYRQVRSSLDEATLVAVAEATGARYYRAHDKDTVEEAFAAIDRERKIEFDARSNLRTRELFAYAAWPGLGLVLLAFGVARQPSRAGEGEP